MVYGVLLLWFLYPIFAAAKAYLILPVFEFGYTVVTRHHPSSPKQEWPDSSSSKATVSLPAVRRHDEEDRGCGSRMPKAEVQKSTGSSATHQTCRPAALPPTFAAPARPNLGSPSGHLRGPESHPPTSDTPLGCHCIGGIAIMAA
jgi:hypothetical protein